MRKLFTLLNVVFTTFAFAQDPVVNIPDQNFKAYLVGNADINTNGDDQIQVSEAQEYTGAIKCSNKNISDLTGIEEFVNIIELNCHTNNLTNLDISQNTALTELNCHTNNLTSLDLSKNTALTNIRCNINNLEILDLSKNTALTNLNCHTNNLTSLDLSKNTALTQIYCNINSLTSLDLSQNIALKRLHCNSNNLSSLNVKNGNNINFSHFNTTNNPDLICIEVDDATYSTENWTNIDSQTTFSENCDYVRVKDFFAPTDVYVFPNPTNDFLNIKTDKNTIENIRIYDIKGSLLYENQNNTTEINLDLSDFNTGIYFVKISSGQGQITHKIIKK